MDSRSHPTYSTPPPLPLSGSYFLIMLLGAVCHPFVLSLLRAKMEASGSSLFSTGCGMVIFTSPVIGVAKPCCVCSRCACTSVSCAILHFMGASKKVQFAQIKVNQFRQRSHNFKFHGPGFVYFIYSCFFVFFSSELFVLFQQRKKKKHTSHLARKYMLAACWLS